MYRLVNGQLLNITEVITPKQTAIVQTTVCPVIGYNSDVAIDFETIPEKAEQDGKTPELHYENGVLVWFYNEVPVPTDERVTQLEGEVSALWYEVMMLGGA